MEDMEFKFWLYPHFCVATAVAAIGVAPIYFVSDVMAFLKVYVLYAVAIMVAAYLLTRNMRWVLYGDRMVVRGMLRTREIPYDSIMMLQLKFAPPYGDLEAAGVRNKLVVVLKDLSRVSITLKNPSALCRELQERAGVDAPFEGFRDE